MSKHFQIAVLGSGPGGYVAALKAGQMGASCAVVEKADLGGTCLNNGCIPSKALLASAELVHHIKHAAEMGVDIAGNIAIRWDTMQARKDNILSTLRGGIKGLLGARKVSIYTGAAKLSGPGKVAVTKPDGSTDSFTADKIILATGSVPFRIPGWPTDATKICTSDEALHWKTLPSKLLIVGGGVIGCEFACMLQPLGVDVTIVEMLPRIIANMDSDLSKALAASLSARGIKILTGVKIEDVSAHGDLIKARLGDGRTLEFDRVLVATGRRANSADIGLDTVGLTTDRGFVRVNNHMETSVKNYYAIGDLNGQCLLAHAASAHGIVAAENALGHVRSFDAPVPNAVYTFPEVASVGMSADEAKGKNIGITVGNFPFKFFGKAMAVNDTDGFVKVVRSRETGELLGVHMIGHNVTECIGSATSLLHQKVKVQDVAETVFAHPTIAEGIKEAAEDALSMGLHLPPRKVIRVAATAN